MILYFTIIDETTYSAGPSSSRNLPLRTRAAQLVLVLSLAAEAAEAAAAEAAAAEAAEASQGLWIS